MKNQTQNITRKQFIELSGLAMIGSSIGASSLLTSCQNTPILGEIVGANHQIGHLIRKAISLPINKIHSHKIIIIGSGISGLTAGHYLQKAGITDYKILELEDHIGGNSTFGKDIDGCYPWAAHYLPIPSVENKDLIDFLAENKIITGFDEQNLPVYDEYSLCFHPEERLFVKGYWQEGLIPNLDISEEDKKQIGDFLAEMEVFKNKKGSDQKWAFDIPLEESSKDALFAQLDSLTMQTWMQQKGYTSKPLQWYVNYGLLDDYGTPLHDVSAWAGIHYFASRRGKAANAQASDVLTWNEGNGHLMQLLAQNQLQHVQTQQLVYHIEEKNDKVMVDVYNWKISTREVYEAEQVIWAIPQMMRPYLMPQAQANFVEKFSYAPWMVANLKTKPFDTGRGQALAWDNVIFEGDGLGYVVANHQNIRREETVWQLTYYKPLYEQQPAEARKNAIQKTHQEWANEVLADLGRVHPNLKENLLKIDIKIWGHAMARPTKGFLFGEERKQAQTPLNNKIHFAHSDLSGISIFEEAFYWGKQAADAAIFRSYA